MPPPTPEDPWVAPLRVQRWQRAAQLFDQEHLQAAPEQWTVEERFVRARIGLELEDWDLVQGLLPRLTELASELQPEVAHIKAGLDNHKSRTKKPNAGSSSNVAAEATEKKTVRGAPNKRLTKADYYAAAERAAGKGQLTATLKALAALKAAPGRSPGRASLLRTEAWAYYKSRKDYRRASELFTQSAESHRKYRQQDLFYAARALSRAHDNDRAIAGYVALAKRYGDSPLAQEARYLAGRLHLIAGRNRAALLLFARYRARAQKGAPNKHLAALRYDAALARLALEEGRAAIEELEPLIAREKSTRNKARLQQLLGLALQYQGRRAEAAERWRAVIQSRPLSLAALLSHQRLVALGEPPPARFQEHHRVPRERLSSHHYKWSFPLDPNI